MYSNGEEMIQYNFLNDFIFISQFANAFFFLKIQTNSPDIQYRLIKTVDSDFKLAITEMPMIKYRSFVLSNFSLEKTNSCYC